MQPRRHNPRSWRELTRCPGDDLLLDSGRFVSSVGGTWGFMPCSAALLSRGAIALACEKLILPAIGHWVHELRQ